MRYNSILLNKLRSNTLFLLTFLLCLFLNPFFGQNKGLKKEEVDIGDMSFGYPKYAKDLIQRKLGDYQNNSELLLISDEILNSFSNEEKFAFCIAFPENYNQNCYVNIEEAAAYAEAAWAADSIAAAHAAAVQPAAAKTATNPKMVTESATKAAAETSPPALPNPPSQPSPTENQLYGFLNINNDGLMMSDRQLMCLKTIRKYVMNSIKVDAELKGYLPLNYKSVIIDLNAVEMIPWLVDFFKRKTKEKDGDILTIFFNLMVVNKYPPFMKSISYQWLFVPSDRRPNSIIFNSANAKLTIERAMGLYSLKQK